MDSGKVAVKIPPDLMPLETVGAVAGSMRVALRSAGCGNPATRSRFTTRPGPCIMHPGNMLQNPEVAARFEKLAAHSDVWSELRSALQGLGEYEIRHGSGEYPALYAVTHGMVFCAASGMSSTYWRLRPGDAAVAARTGANRTDIGPEWVEIKLFEPGWPKPDLRHWALRAYDFARTGA